MSDMPTMPAPETQSSHWLTRQNALVMLLIALTLVAFLLCFLILRPFLASLAWALALAVVAHPVHSWIKARVGNPNLAAGLAVVLITLILIVPAVFVVHQLLQEAVANFQFFQAPEETLREPLEASALGDTIRWLDDRLDMSGQVRRFFEFLAGSVIEILRQSVWTIVQFLVTLFTLFFLLRDRRQALEALRSLVPLSRAETDGVFHQVADTIHATVYGSVLMGILQGTLGGLMFWILGLPAPMLWGVVMAILATVPNLGSFVVWAPAAVALALQGDMGKATILALWGLIAIGLIDNLLYPFVVGQRMRMHSLPVFFAILGGLIVFGVAGMILGPVVFSVTHALVEIWRRRTANGRAAETGVPETVAAIQERSV